MPTRSKGSFQFPCYNTNMSRILSDYGYDSGYIDLADLTFKELPDSLKIKGYNLFLKSEFHITLICAKRIAAIINAEKIEELEADIVKEFIDYASKKPLLNYKPSKVFKFVERDEKKTLIIMVEVPGLEQFFKLLSKKYKKDLPLQPTHVTLYTLQPNIGIGILSIEQLELDSETVEVDSLKNSRFINIPKV